MSAEVPMDAEIRIFRPGVVVPCAISRSYVAATIRIGVTEEIPGRANFLQAW